MSLCFRFLLLTGLFLAMVMAIGWVAFASFQRIDRALLLEHHRSFQSEIHAVSGQVRLTAQVKEWEGFVVAESEDERDRRWEAFVREEAEMRRQLDLLMAGLPVNSEASRLLAQFLNQHRDMGDACRSARADLDSGVAGSRARALAVVSEAEAAPMETFGRVVLTLSSERQSMAASMEWEKVRNVALTVALMGGAMLVAFLVVVFLTSRWVNRPLHEIVKQADKIAGGEFEQHDSPSNSVEVVKLQGAINKMSSSLKVNYDHLQEINLRLEQARDEALDTSRLKSEFLANVSHEMRTPLNGVIGMSELLMETELDREQTTMASIMRSSGRTLLAVINDLLDFSKIEADHIDLQEIDFELESVLEESILVVAPKVDANEVALGFVVESGVPARLNGDPLRVKQVLINLLSNASKFTAKGEISVRVRLLEASEQKSRLEIAVRDTGVGIPKEKQDLIFEAFRQVDGSTTREHSGTGLGLAITSRLVTMMNGSIRVESVEGEGSLFVAEVCLGVPELPSAGWSVASDGLVGRKILVVDDHEINREILTRRLEGWGCRTKAVCSGPEALALLGRNRDFDLILTDFQMPGMTGCELAERLLASESLRDIPRVLLTSVAPGHGMEHRPGGVFSAVATKPIIKQTLFEVLVGVLAVPVVGHARSIAGQDAGPGEYNRNRSQDELDARLLVAEDDPMNRKYISLLLRKAGFQHDVVENGEQALEAVESGDYNLVLMDCSMPVMDGYQATELIRERMTRQEAPYIIGLTGHTGREARDRCMESGMDHYLTKPIEPQRLCEELRIALEARLVS